MNEKIYKTMSSTGACTDNRNRNRDYDDRKRCKTAEKEIRYIDIKDRINHMGKFFELSVSDREIALCGFSVRNRRKH